MYGLFCWWWLRSPGNNQNNAANVNNGGGINENGNNVNNSNDAVRPALLSSSLKRLCKYATPVPRAKESDSFSIFSGKYMSVAEVTLFALHSNGRKMIVHSCLPALPMRFYIMMDYEKIYDFQNLYKAHTVARRGKRNTREVVEFEMNLGKNLATLSDEIKNGIYKMQDYYSFAIYDPKYRVIHALHYRDRVVQHCLCDEVLAPLLDKKLIYDNAACRIGKGTHFAIDRVSKFLHLFYKKYGTNGYFLKCDIRKFFDNIDHSILKQKLAKVIDYKKVLALLDHIIDSFEVTPGKGLPLGNQTSQWFAIFYLDGLDRLIKEKLHIKYYSRYMDDCVLIHQDKEYLRNCLEQMRQCAKNLKIEFNEKTEIFPIKNGVEYLGWHIYLTETGKIIRKVKQQTKYKYKRKLKYFQKAYGDNRIDLAEINQVLTSYRAHLSNGHTYKLQEKLMNEFVLVKGEQNYCD